MLTTLDAVMWRHRIAPKTILHLGAWEGKSEAELYSRTCEGKSIFVEALPRVFAKLKANIAKYPNHVALNACVGEEDGKKVTFHEASNAGQSSSMRQFGTHSTVHPDVTFIGDLEMEMTRVDTLLAKNGIDIIGPAFGVLDLQGCEMGALVSMQSLLPRFDWLFCEVNAKPLYEGCALIGEIDAFLETFGFYRADTYWFSATAGWGDAIYKKSNTKGDLA